MKLLTSLAAFSIAIQFWSAASAQELKKIRIGYPSLSFRQSNVWVAKEDGLFKKYGLEVEPIFSRRPSRHAGIGRRRPADREYRHRHPGELARP